MSIPVKELKEWLDTLDSEDSVFIDEDGLTMCSENESKAYIEIGGTDMYLGDDPALDD